MGKPQIVIDTNVFIAALRSRRGASHRLLLLIDSGKFEANVSVPLILEYEDVAKRFVSELSLTSKDIDNIIDYICRVANRWKIYYLWRPLLRDPKDDMVLELAITSVSDTIVTYNKRDFEDIKRLGFRVLTPKEFLEEIGELP